MQNSKQIKKKISVKGAARKSSNLKKRRFAQLMGKESSRPELKVVDVCDVGSAPVVSLVSTTATIDLLNGLDLGTAAFTRVGRTVCLRSLHVRGGLYPSGNTGSTGGECLRLMVVYDRQPNGALPIMADIIQSIDANGNGSTTAFDYPNLTNSDRFLILADQQVNVPNTLITGGAVQEVLSNLGQLAVFDRYIDVSNLPTQYKGDTDGIASIASGALYMVTLGTAAAAAAGVTFNWTSRLRYTDN